MTAPSAGSVGELLLFRLRSLGWSGALGLTLGAGGIVVAIAYSAYAEKRIEQAHAEVATLRARLGASPSEAGPTERLEAFRAALRAPVERGARELPSQHIHRLAKRHGVTIERGEYQVTRDASTSIARHRMSIPAQATYPEVRRWLAALTAAYPGLAIEGIALKRDTASTDVLDAQLRLSVFLSGS